MSYEANKFGQIIEFVDAEVLRDFNEGLYGKVLGVERIVEHDTFIGLVDSEHLVILDRYTDQIKAGTSGFSDDEALMQLVRNWQGVMTSYDDDDDDDDGYTVYVGPEA